MNKDKSPEWLWYAYWLLVLSPLLYMAGFYFWLKATTWISEYLYPHDHKMKEAMFIPLLASPLVMITVLYYSFVQWIRYGYPGWMAMRLY